jgi:hypothetical protein
MARVAGVERADNILLFGFRWVFFHLSDYDFSPG